MNDACTQYRKTLNAALDDYALADALTHPHTMTCADCRAESNLAALLMREFARSESPQPPAGFAAKVTKAAVRDRLQRRVIRWSGATLTGALAAGLLLAFVTNRPQPTRTETATAPLGPQLRDAGTAFVALTKRTTDETLAPAKTLFVAPSVSLEQPPRPTMPEPLAAVPDAARMSVEPITGTARRALNLFVRDFGGAAGLGKRDS